VRRLLEEEKVDPARVSGSGKGGRLTKGDVLAVARVAGIQAAKRTPDLIPLCHQLTIGAVYVNFTIGDDNVEVECQVETVDRTGVEMEALTAVAVAGDGKLAMGLSNQTSFLRPITQGTIHATARARHKGRTTWVWEVEISDDDGRLCVLTRMTVAVRDR